MSPLRKFARAAGGAASPVARPGIPPALWAHFAAHNRQVIFLALAALAGALGFWALLYGMLYWVLLLVSSAAGGLDARVTPFFTEAFIASALLLCGLVLFAQHVGPRRQSPRDHKPFTEHFADILLMVPRMTLFVWSVLSAYQFLDKKEMRLAWRLLQRIENERKVSVSSVPLDIPDQKMREKILTALQLVELVDFRKSEGDWTLRLKDDKARKLCQRMVRIRTGGSGS